MISLFRRYWNNLVSTEGGLALLWMDGLLLVPLIMAAFFYPMQVLLWGGIALVLTITAYEGYVLWRKRHPLIP